jgi:putative transposase
LLKRLLHKQGCRPRRMVTDKLNSYAAAPQPSAIGYESGP